jgi:hypothetical protein
VRRLLGEAGEDPDRVGEEFRLRAGDPLGQLLELAASRFDIFTLALRMGTSVKMIDRTYGHLIAGADEYERELLDRFDNGRSEPDGRYLGGEEDADAA